MVPFIKVKPRMEPSMAKVGSNMLTAIFIKEIGRMESPTDTAYMSMLKVQSTKALGSTICMMEKALRPGTKAISNTRAISKQARRLAKENLSLMEIIMRGIS